MARIPDNDFYQGLLVFWILIMIVIDIVRIHFFLVSIIGVFFAGISRSKLSGQLFVRSSPLLVAWCVGTVYVFISALETATFIF